VDIELYQAFVAHFQQERLASFLIPDIGASHDFEHFERLLAERVQYIFSIIQHDSTPTITSALINGNTIADLPSPLAQYYPICS
jgi:hypothetical protein